MSIGSLGKIAGSGHPNQAGFGDRITEVTIRPETLEQITARPPERPRHRAEQGEPVEPPSNFWVHPEALAVARVLTREQQTKTETPIIARPFDAPNEQGVRRFGGVVIVGSRTGVHAAIRRMQGDTRTPQHRAPVREQASSPTQATPDRPNPITTFDPTTIGLPPETNDIDTIVARMRAELDRTNGTHAVIRPMGGSVVNDCFIICNNEHSAAAIARNHTL